MPNGWTDDMGQDDPYDEFYDESNPDTFITDDETIQHWNEAYRTTRGVQTRIDEDMVSPRQLYESDYRIDENGDVVPISPSQKFFRDYGFLIIAGIALKYGGII